MSENSLVEGKILDLFGEQGAFSKAIPHFELRPQQEQMLRKIIEAYNHNRIALMEAGTGTGKSFAYLIPSIIFSRVTGERILISTHTIALQEQLIKKDIPLVTKALGMDVKAVLIKGMSNYLCLRKLDEAEEEHRIFPSKETEDLAKIREWSRYTPDGSRSTLGYATPVWEKVSADQVTCNRKECPHYKQCFFFKARLQAQDAQLMIVNHHLLCADISQREILNDYQSTFVLPNYKRVVVDEAHHLEDVATHFFGAKTSYLEMIHFLNKVASDKGKLMLLKDKISKKELSGMRAILDRMTFDMPILRRDISTHIKNFFEAIYHLLPLSSGGDEQQLRLNETYFHNAVWQQEVLPHAEQLKTSMARWVQFVQGIENGLAQLKDTNLDEQTKSLRHDMIALTGLLANAHEHVQHCLDRNFTPGTVRWIESVRVKGGMNTLLTEAPLSMAAKLAQGLFNPMDSVILCSATLAAGKDFAFAKQRLGLTPELLENKKLIEELLDSPFDFKKQAMLAVPVDLAHPSDEKFLPDCSEIIWEAIQASHGQAFVLFTSYKMLKEVDALLAERMKTHRFPVFRQGEDTVQGLITRFKQTERAVLFGTDSFWEGVDVAGEALRCVILTKLPFRVPTEPIVQARSEAILAAGGNPFNDLSLPQAVVKFKQGFGRLVRSKKDRGCIICLDTRIILKGYGKTFLNSLPDCQQAFVKKSELPQLMRDFYKSTYYLTQ